MMAALFEALDQTAPKTAMVCTWGLAYKTLRFRWGSHNPMGEGIVMMIDADGLLSDTNIDSNW